MSGLAQVLAFVIGLLIIAFVTIEAILVLGGAVVGMIFPLLIGIALVAPAVMARRKVPNEDH